MKAVLILLACYFTVSLAVTGVDVSSALGSAWSCLRSNGYSFGIIRGYQSGGRLDPNVVANIRNARAAGIPYVDVYIFPCVPCGNPAGQMQTLVRGITGENYGMIWLDIERLSWSGDLTTNRNFITGLINEGAALGKKLGVYTNYNNWEAIVGVSWAGAAHLPLWYAHYDNVPNFNDFQAFGGWTKPNIKQYAGDKTVCGAGVDLNWYP